MKKKSKRDKGAIEKTNDKKGERGYFQLNAMTKVWTSRNKYSSAKASAKQKRVQTNGRT